MIARILTAEQAAALGVNELNQGPTRLGSFTCATAEGDPCPDGRRAIPADCWAEALPGGSLEALGAALPWLLTLPEADVQPYHAPEPN